MEMSPRSPSLPWFFHVKKERKKETYWIYHFKVLFFHILMFLNSGCIIEPVCLSCYGILPRHCSGLRCPSPTCPELGVHSCLPHWTQTGCRDLPQPRLERLQGASTANDCLEIPRSSPCLNLEATLKSHSSSRAPQGWQGVLAATSLQSSFSLCQTLPSSLPYRCISKNSL